MPDKKQESAFDVIAKGMTSFIKAKTAQDQAKLKVQSTLMLKDIEQKQNFMYKIAEKEHITPYQQIMSQIAQKEYPGLDLSGITGTQDRMPYGVMTEGRGARPGGAPSQFGVQFGKEGISLKPRGLKDIVERIHMKPRDSWTSKERQLVTQYQSMASKDRAPSWKQQQEVEAIKRGIGQGVIAIKNEWGGTEILRPGTKDEATEALVRGGHNPYLYEDELEARYGAAETPGEITLPEEITTTSQARDYLIGQGMTEEKAIEWLRSQ